MHENLFVYGTLRDADVQNRVIGRTVNGIPDILDNYQKSEITIGKKVYPILTPDPGNSVSGLVLKLTQKELLLTDEYETNAYERILQVLKSGREAWVYVASASS